MKKYKKIIESNIERIDLDEVNYSHINFSLIVSSLFRRCLIRCENSKNNSVLIKGLKEKSKLDIKFSKNSKNNSVYIGDGFKGRLRLRVNASNCHVYIGNNVELGGVLVDMYQDDTEVAIGNGVTTGPGCAFYCNEPDSGFIIGDDCMLSKDISLRSTDGHPIFDPFSYQQVNLSKRPIVVEPHVWIGERVAICKNVTVGAGSVLGVASVVTKDVERFSSAAGIPASKKNSKDILWSRSRQEEDMDKMKYYQKKFNSRMQ